MNDTICREPGCHVVIVGRLQPTPNDRNVTEGGVEPTVDVCDLDDAKVAHICPMGTTVIPSIGGVSHSPKAFSKAEDVVHGVNVLLNAVKRVDAL